MRLSTLFSVHDIRDIPSAKSGANNICVSKWFFWAIILFSSPSFWLFMSYKSLQIIQKQSCSEWPETHFGFGIYEIEFFFKWPPPSNQPTVLTYA